MNWNEIYQRYRRCWIGLLVLCISFLTACSVPQVSAEDRLFLNLSLDFLGEYQLPRMEFEGTRVGGLSAITYDRQRDRYYAISDDRSNFAPARFYTLALSLNTTDSKTPAIKQVTVERVTTMTGEDGKPYPPGTVDPEGIVLSPLGTVFIASEGVAQDGIPPFVREFDLKTGQWKRSLPIPERYIPIISQPEVSKLESRESDSSNADTKKPEQVKGVQNNLGFESLTLNPGGYGSTGVEPFRLFVATEAALLQDRNPSDRGDRSRLLHYLAEPGRALLVSEHLYLLDPPPTAADTSGLVELLAIDQGGHFLSLERTYGRGRFGVRLYQLAMGDATDTSTIASVRDSNIRPIRKKLLLDLEQLGIRLDNLEGMTLGPRLPDGSQSLVLVSDDNFLPVQNTQFLLFRLRGLT